jgi:flagellin-like protein
MKGVSPLIASVFLIVMVISLASLITTWMITLVKETQSSVGERTAKTIDCSNAAITIDNVFLNPSERTARIIVRNSGFVDGLEITSSELLDITGNTFSASGLPLIINKGDVATILFEDHNINMCSNFMQALVSTTCGGVHDIFTSTPVCL